MVFIFHFCGILNGFGVDWVVMKWEWINKNVEKTLDNPNLLKPRSEF
jgi:hypothetical protein